MREEDGRTHRVRPTRVAPLTLFLREDAEWLLAGPRPAPDASLSHPAREVLAELHHRGASFFPELARATGRLASEVEDALWELVAAGLVTADGFENLRALVDPKRRRGEGRGRMARPRHAAGRWALLRHAAEPRTEISPSLSRVSCCGDGAWSSAIWPRAKRWRRRGGPADGIAPHGSARRNPRRPLRQRIPRRAVRAARGARFAARRAPLRRIRRASGNAAGRSVYLAVSLPAAPAASPASCRTRGRTCPGGDVESWVLQTDRRSFLAAAGAAALASSLRAAGRGSVRLGGPIFLKSEDPVN